MKVTDSDFISVKPGSSKALQWLLILFHILAAIAVILSGFAVLILVVLVHFIWMYKLYFTTETAYQLSYDPVQHWSLSFQKNQPEPVTLLDSTVSTTFMVIIHARLTTGEIRYLVIFYDALPDDQFRRLRVLIRLHHTLDREEPSA